MTSSEQKRQHQRPEGRLIEAAMKRKRWKSPRVATEAGVGVEWVRNIVNGYRSGGAGNPPVPVPGTPETVAQIAKAVGVSAAQLRDAGRDDAAAELELLGDAGFHAEVAESSGPLRRLLGIRNDIDALIDDLRRDDPPGA